MPSAAAAARMARNGGTTSLCKAQGGSVSSDRWFLALPGQLIQREFRGFGHGRHPYPSLSAELIDIAGRLPDSESGPWPESAWVRLRANQEVPGTP